jgi:hypothetical protein
MKRDTQGFVNPSSIQKELLQAVDSMQEAFREEQLTNPFEEGLTPPTEQGPYALMAPDGIMVMVVDRAITQDDLEAMIRDDVSKRMMRSFFEQGKANHRNPAQLIVESFPEYLRLRKQYRLERLSG